MNLMNFDSILKACITSKPARSTLGIKIYSVTGYSFISAQSTLGMVGLIARLRAVFKGGCIIFIQGDV